MIVAGFEFTSETRRPSCLSTLIAWVPEESNSHARPPPTDAGERGGGGGGPGARRGGVGAGAPRPVREPEALDGAVVQVLVCQHEAGLVEKLRVDAEAVVLGCDLALAGLEVLHRVVGSPVPELELVGPPAARERQDLVPEADAECGQAVDEHLGRLDRVAAGVRGPRPVREEDAPGAGGGAEGR